MIKHMSHKIWVFLQAWAEARAMQDIMIREFRNRNAKRQGE